MNEINAIVQPDSKRNESTNEPNATPITADEPQDTQAVTGSNGEQNTGAKIYKRYPGIASFEDSDLGNALFFGRNEESQKMLHYILAENLVVLFSYSGYGKTSLLKARVFKDLREKNYYPKLIRFNKREFTPQSLIRIEMDALEPGEQVEKIRNNSNSNEKADDSLVEYFKRLEIWSGDEKLLTPVIVFDQFEEIFTLDHNQEHNDAFFKELALLLNEVKESSLKVKIVISIREDFLGHLERMSVDIPSVFTNRFRLEPLRKKQAEEAIEKPASLVKEDITFASRPFCYSSDALNTLIEFLSLKLTDESWKNSEEIEPSQLQIICSQLENKVISEKIKENAEHKLEIKTTDFGGKEGLQKMISNFYDEQITNVKNKYRLTEKQVLSIKNLIETGLIASGRRVPLSYNSIVEKPEIHKEAVNTLIDNKLLKLESHRGNLLLELTHDTLIAPVLSSGKHNQEEIERRKKQKKIARNVSIGLLSLLILGYALYSFISSKTGSQEKYYYAAFMAGRDNPTLAYKIAMDGENPVYTSKKLKNLLAEYRNNNYWYITNRMDVHDDVLQATFSHDKKNITIYFSDKREVWTTRGALYKSYTNNDKNIASAAIWSGGKYYSISNPDTMINIFDDQERLVTEIPMKDILIDKQNDPYSATRFYENILKYFKPQNTTSSITTLTTFSYDARETLIESNNHQQAILFYKNNCYLHDIATDSFYILFRDTAFIPFKNGSTLTGTPATSNKPAKSNSFFPQSDTMESVNAGGEIMSLVVSNNFKKLLYSKGNSVNIIDIQHNKKVSTSTFKALPFPVTYIQISPNDSLIFTSGDGTLAKIWTFAGQEVASMQGVQNEINLAAFSDDCKDLVTIDKYGYIFTWKSGKDIKTAADLMKFSPFEYHTLGLTEPRYNASKIYDCETLNGLLAGVKHYQLSLPVVNFYPNDPNYTENLISSSEEVADMYEAIFRNDSFKTLNESDQFDIYHKYTNLLLSTSDLLDTEKGFDTKWATRLDKYTNMRIAKLDKTKDSSSAYTTVVDELQGFMLYFYRKKDYKNTCDYARKIVDLWEVIQAKDKDRSVYLHSNAYVSLSFYSLFIRDFKTAIDASNRALQLDSLNTIAYTNLALGYLLTHKYNEAWSIYRKYNYDLAGSFLKDFKALEDAGIITNDDKELSTQIAKIKEMLGGEEKSVN